jgi:prolyl oligopeptidase
MAALTSLDVPDRIPLGRMDHDYLYNFHQDKAHKRGIWRRTSIADYQNAHPHWQTLIDLDALDRIEKTDFVWQGADCAPGGKSCMVLLSPGGGDKGVAREFDLATRTFQPHGFVLKPAKLQTAWLDADTLLVASDFGPGSMTTSSYPRSVRLWRRGEPLAKASTLFTGAQSDVAVQPYVFHGPYGRVALIERALTFFTSQFYGLGLNDSLARLPLPEGAAIRGVSDGWLIFTTRHAWTAPDGNTFTQGALAAFNVQDFLKGMPPRFERLYTPGPTSVVEDVGAGQSGVYAAIFTDVQGAIHHFQRGADGHWQDETLALPKGGATGIASVNAWGPQAQFTFESYVTPPSLYQMDGTGEPRRIKSQRPVFDASALSVTRHWAVSKDGTKIPYTLFRKKGQTGPVPTIVYGYGGFELSLFPVYWNDGHRPLAPWVWIARGGALAIANIRGGGEFGPAWHQAAMKAHRQRAFDDFAAVIGDLQHRGVTTPKQTGIVGASNGGLLVTVTMTQHPELLGAVVAQRPLIDMLHYTQYGAGASWVAEYGDPAIPAERAVIARYSPYQHVQAGVDYPPALFITETSDDRVTPVFARMMAAKMEAQGYSVLFNESTQGGHGPGSTNAAQAAMWGLTYAFFGLKLGLP